MSPAPREDALDAIWQLQRWIERCGENLNAGPAELGARHSEIRPLLDRYQRAYAAADYEAKREIEQRVAELEMQCRAKLHLAQELLETALNDEARAENQYRLAKATAMLTAEGTVQERQARADKATDEERLRAHLSAGRAKAALEKVRNHRVELSALSRAIANQWTAPTS